MRVIFMGTPQFAVSVLKQIIESKHEIAMVVTQPDKPGGRRQQIVSPPVKQFAAEENIPVLQPSNLNDEEFKARIRAVNADIGVVFAYGKIIPQYLLDQPKYGLVNIHVSLLPRWRGAAPIQRAIMAGDRTTGVTIMRLDVGLDTGDIIMQQEIPIEPQDTSGSITDRISDIGIELLIKALEEIEKGTVVMRKQDESQATYAEKITDNDTEIDWRKPSATIDNQVRALNPKPGAFTYYNDMKLKIWRVSRVDMYNRFTKEELSEGESLKIEYVYENRDEVGCDKPGTVAIIDKQRGPAITTGDGILFLEEVQPENKKRMSGAEFVRGYRLQVGGKLGRDRLEV